MQKKCLLLCLLILFLASGLLGGCVPKEAPEKDSSNDDYVTAEGLVGSVTKEGKLYCDFLHGNLLTFYDFKTLQNIILCDRPNCSHDSASCNAYTDGYVLGLGLYKDKIYYFSTNEAINQSKFISCDKNGANRKELLTIPVGAPVYRTVFTEDKVYFDTCYLEWSQEEMINNLPSHQAYGIGCIDLKKNQYTQLYQEDMDQNNSFRLTGYDQGVLYYSTAKYLLEESSDTGEETFVSVSSREMDFDIATGEVTDSAVYEFLPAGFKIGNVHLSQSYYVFDAKNADNTAVILGYLNLRSNEHEIFFEGDSVSAAQYLDQKIFYLTFDEEGRNIQHYYDLQTKRAEVVPSNLEITTALYVRYEAGDRFIGIVSTEYNPKTHTGNNAKAFWISKEDYYNGMENYVVISDVA